MVIRLGNLAENVFGFYSLGHEERKVQSPIIQGRTATIETFVWAEGAAGTNGGTAMALRQLAEGQTIRKVAASIGLTPKTVWLVSQHYRQGA